MAKNSDDVVTLLYGSETTYNHCVAWCKYHHCHLTPKQIRKKDCLGKQCKCLEKIPHQWWEFREQKKLNKKEKLN